MKSIQYFIRKAFFYFSLGLICLAAISFVSYSAHLYNSKLKIFDETAYKISQQGLAGTRSAYNNILVAEQVLLDQIQKRKIDSEFVSEVYASTINYNPAQFNIWFALDEKIVKQLPGKPPGLLFLVMKKPQMYRNAIQYFGIEDFKFPFNSNNFTVNEFKHDIYHKDHSLQWYHLPKKNPGKIEYINAYFDDIYTNKWLFTFSKAVTDKNGHFIGVTGIDYSIDTVRNIFDPLTRDLGIAVFQIQNGAPLFEHSHMQPAVIKDDDLYKPHYQNPFGTPEELEKKSQSEKLYFSRVNGEWVVYKVHKLLTGAWFYVLYQSAWNFLREILLMLAALTTVIIALLTFLLFHLLGIRNKILNTINDLIFSLKRDTEIIGVQKSFSVYYPKSDVLEINEIINCVNALIKVVNENFQNYRNELEKNIKSKEELEVLVKKRSEQLIESEKLASLGFMSAGLAHEIKNPLNLICNAAEIVSLQLKKLNDYGLPIDEKINRAISHLTESNHIILENGHRVDNIIKTLLMQIRNSKDGHEHLVDIGVLIKTNLEFVLSNYRPKLNNRINIELKLPPNQIIIRGNPVDLGRVFINIFDNSCYAMIKKINADSNYIAELKISLQSLEQGINIMIRDNGIGIPQSDLSQIFTPFFTSKPPGEGTGLGLSFAYEIVKHHGGNLITSSTQNEFTEIVMNLPYQGHA